MTQKENWLKNYNLVRKYYEENGDLLVPYKYEVKEEGKVVKLGTWISTQRKIYKKKSQKAITSALRHFSGLGYSIKRISS